MTALKTISKTDTDHDLQSFFRRQVIVGNLGFVQTSIEGETVLSTDIFEDALAALDLVFHNKKVAPDFWEATNCLLTVMYPKMEQSTYWDRWRPYLYEALALSQKVGDIHTEAILTLQIGIIQQRQGQLESARKWFENTTCCAQQVHDQSTWAAALNRLGLMASVQHELVSATNYIEQALRLLSDNDPGREFSYFVLGDIAIHQNQFEKAIQYLKKSLSIGRQYQNVHLIGSCLNNLATAYLYQGNYQDALDTYEEATNLLRTIGDEVEWAITKMNQGMVYEYQHNTEMAINCFLEAKPTLEKMRNSVNLAKLYNNQAYCHYQLEEWDKSEEMYQASLVQYQQIGTSIHYANALDGLGLVYHAQEKWDEAIVVYEDALQILSDVTKSPQLWDEITAHLEITRTAKVCAG